MFVDRLYFPVTTLGPGERIVVWTCGCSKHCPGCANPELWEMRPDAAISVERLADILLRTARHSGAHRITFTGGDPLEQAEELAALLAAIRPAFDDILVYTGFTVDLPHGAGVVEGFFSLDETIPTAAAPFPLSPTLFSFIDVLIDGPYMEALNDGVCGLRGSTNQRVIVMNPALEKLYHDEVQKPRRVQNAVFDGRAMSIGIHGRPRGEDRP